MLSQKNTDVFILNIVCWAECPVEPLWGSVPIESLLFWKKKKKETYISWALWWEVGRPGAKAQSGPLSILFVFKQAAKVCKCVNYYFPNIKHLI